MVEPFKQVKEMMNALNGAPVSVRHIHPNHEDRSYYRRHKKRGPYKARKAVTNG